MWGWGDGDGEMGRVGGRKRKGSDKMILSCSVLGQTKKKSEK